MKRFFKMLGYVMLYIGVYFAIFSTIKYVWYNVLPQNPTLNDFVYSNPLGIVVFNDVFALPIFAIMVYFVKKKSILKIALFKKTSISNILLSVIIGICMGIFTTSFFALPFCKKIPKFEELISFIYNSGGLIVFIGFVVIGTFFKEILFRGLIFNELRATMPIAIAVLLHAVIYGALFFNFDPALTIFGTLGNIVVVLTYVISGSIWAPYVAQAMNNVCIYIIRNYSGDIFGANKWIPIIISTVIMIAAFVYMNFLRKAKITKASQENVELSMNGSVTL